MRIDKYLKETGIIKRRSLAKDLLDNNHIMVDNKPAKASYTIKKGEVIQIQKGQLCIILEVLDIPIRNLKKEERADYYKIIKKDNIPDED